MSLLTVSKYIVAACNDIFSPTFIASVLTVLYFSFHPISLAVAFVLLSADLVVHLSRKEKTNE